MNDKDWVYVLRCEPQTHRQNPNFYEYHSCTIQQAGDEIEREKLFLICIIYCSTVTLVFFSLVKAQVYFFAQWYAHLNVKLFIHVFMSPCFLCAGEKRVSLIVCVI